MTRKIFSLIVFLLVFSFGFTYADEIKRVNLNNEDHKRETVEFESYSIHLELEEADEENMNVNIYVENRQNSDYILLFKQNYEEKPLKKRRPVPIVYAKNFGGSKWTRISDPCVGLNDDYQIEPSARKHILTLPEVNTENKSCRLPVYIAQKDRRSFLCKKPRFVLSEKQVVELDIHVELKPDTTYLQLQRECSNLIEEFAHVLFCTNTKHKPSLAEQKEGFQRKIDALISKISREIDRRGWFSTDKRYQLYDELRIQLSRLDLTSKEGDCGNHKAPAHKCRYCNLTLQQIYHKLDDYYQMLYISSDRKATKTEIIGDVKVLYNCCTHRRQGNEWNNSEYKSKIIDRYNRINKF